MTLTPRVTDISHHNTVTNLRATAAAGIWGVIHKATQGTSYRDPDYVRRRQQVLQAGMLWGAYHFGDNSDPAAQVSAFIAYARPDASTLLCLDYEDHPTRSRTMQPRQMVAFLREIERRTGRRAMLYGGNRIKEDMPRLSREDQAYVASHPLWLCQYGENPKLPIGFTRSALWQYTDGNVGPQPHRIPGIGGEVDLNAFNGTRADLEALWRGPITDVEAAAFPDTDISAQSKPPRGADDASPQQPGDDTSIPPFLQPNVPDSRGINVQPVQARYDVTVEVIQRELKALGYYEVGDVDGRWGGKTAAGIKAFFTDRGINETAAPGPTLNAEIARAKAQGFMRPIAPARANATEKDIAPKVETVRVSLWGRFTAKIAAGFAALGLGGSTVSNAFQSVQDTFYPVRNFFAKIPPEVWFLLMGLVACAVWYITNRAAKAATNDYNTGRLN